ncbi:c-type cytochrome [Nitratiruptor tergarcus]|uniref:Cytochrome c553 n=1 Tax=Nitratiruptor tergarcus DSM 16512 TaxID=1069081 RepID=A0A1W1WRG1_9BACT|nr:c-type cytochrome [Nitratiruptor tergarcus]SMC08590.1 Cytochrome c553 [Nitratiruptor tergarcus DSM 16512]
MIRHIIAAIAAALTVWAILYMAKLDQEVNRLQMIHEIIQKSKLEVPMAKKATPTQQPQKAEESEEEKKLKVLKEKAGRMSAFEVSTTYRRNCASCHGINGEGAVGPKLIGKNKEYILQALKDFKSGKRKNYVMYGLLQQLDDKELDDLATEIGSFAQKLKEAQ